MNTGVGLTISEEKIISKKFGNVVMDLTSVGIPGFRRLRFPRNPFGIPTEDNLKSRKSVFQNRKKVLKFRCVPRC